MQAMEPDESGFVERDGVRTYWEVYGDGGPTVFLFPPWQIVHSRYWKAQIPALARRYRVVTFDPRGNGRSDRPAERAAYADTEVVADALAVLDATGTDRAVVVGLSLSGWWTVVLAAEHPERVLGLALLAPVCPLVPLPEWFGRIADVLDDDDHEGFAKVNHGYWRRDYPGFLRFFFEQVFTEPHSTKQIEDGVRFGLDTTAGTLVSTLPFPSEHLGRAEEVYAQVRCPAIVVNGADDVITPPEQGVAAAAALGATLVTVNGGGHSAVARDPVRIQLILRDFVDSVCPPAPQVRSWTRARIRPRRALYLSSPIGLGHARRDVAIADELRKLHPDLEVDWLAQHPVTEVLAAAGERIHPASAFLASESGHLESEAGEHDLHCFGAWRRMDEILMANFMVFHDVVADGHYDLVVGDEAWDVDYHLHENPELKRAEFAWLTDFVGWLPMPDGGEHEARLTADYNAEMVEQRARFPRLRSRSIFVGNPDDLVTARLGPDLPTVAEWTTANFDFAGYVTGFDPAALPERAELRAGLGWADDEQVCVVTVGGSAVGAPLLRRVMAACPMAAERVPGLRMVVVAGPRIEPKSFPATEGVEILGHVPDLYRHLAACDLAVVQGGLTTTMELTAARRPFLSFPLAHHFEQQIHVAHRLARYGAGRSMDYEAAPPEVIAEAMAAEIGRPVDYRAVETDGAARAAAMIAELL